MASAFSSSLRRSPGILSGGTWQSPAPRAPRTAGALTGTSLSQMVKTAPTATQPTGPVAAGTAPQQGGILSRLFNRSPTEVTGTTTSEPWAPTQPHVTGILDQAQSLYDTQAGQPMNPVVRQGLMGNIGTAAGVANTGGITTEGQFNTLYGQAGQPGAAEQYLTGTARGDYLNSDPNLDAVINDASSSIRTQLQDIYSGAGRYGGSAMNNDLINRLYANEAGTRSAAYQTERDRMMNAAGALEGAQQGRLGLRQGLLGDLTNVQQGKITNRYGANDRLMAMGEYQRGQPWDLLNRYAGLAYPAAGLGGTASTEEPRTPIWQKLLGGLAGIGGLFGSFG